MAAFHRVTDGVDHAAAHPGAHRDHLVDRIELDANPVTAAAMAPSTRLRENRIPSTKPEPAKSSMAATPPTGDTEQPAPHHQRHRHEEGAHPVLPHPFVVGQTGVEPRLPHRFASCASEP